jgi:parallel beta-helix repeat protein
MAVYYVKNGGSDAASGLSDALAWATINKVNISTFAAGDFILFNKGDTWRETLTVPSNGSVSNPITFGAYGVGDAPIIQPTTQVTSWTQVGATDVWYGTLTTAPSQVFISDVYVQPAHWPTTVGASSPTFEYPSGNSANSTHLTDALLHGTTEADLVGAKVNIYTNLFTFYGGPSAVAISAWDDATHILTMGDVATTPVTTMKYYLTAPAGAGIPYSSKSWMVTENTWFYDTDAQRLYVYKTGGGNPGTAEASTLDYDGIICMTHDNITIDGLEIRYAKRYGIVQGHSNNFIVKNCEISYTGSGGIYAYEDAGHLTGVRIEDNDIHDITLYGIKIDEASGSIIDGNTMARVGGIYPLLPSAYSMIYQSSIAEAPLANTISNNTLSYSPSVGVNNISWNSIISGNDVSYTDIFLPDGGGIYTDRPGVTISDNILHGGTGYGIYCDWNSDNSIIENNSVTGGTTGMVLHESGGNIVRYNSLTGPFVLNPYGGSVAGGIFLNQGAQVNSNDIYYNKINVVDKAYNGIDYLAPGNCLDDIYNNIITNCAVGLRVIYDDVADLVDNVENNIFYNNTTHINANAGNINVLNYNLYYGTGNWIWEFDTWVTFANWKTYSSLDVNSLNSDPLFVGGSPYSYQLQAGSPAIDAGVNVGLTKDILGYGIVGMPDIGAYEYAGVPWWINQYVEYVDPATGLKYRDGVRNTEYVIDKELVLYGFTTDVGGGEGEDVDWENVYILPESGVYYVSNAGDDSNSGLTEATSWAHHPWMNTWTGTTTLVPGDIISMKRGDTWTIASPAAAYMTVGQSGTVGLPITTNAYGTGAKPIINISTNTNYPVITGLGKSYITFDNLEITHYAATRAYTGYRDGINFGKDAGLIVPHDWVITNCAIHNIPTYGIRGKDDAYNITIGDTTAIATATSVAYNNHIYDVGVGAIALIGRNPVTNISNFKIYYNYIHDIDMAGVALEDAYGIAFGMLPTGTGQLNSDGWPVECYVRYNRVENNPCWEGISCHGATRIYVQDNYVKNVHWPIKLFAADKGVTYPNPTLSYAYINNNIVEISATPLLVGATGIILISENDIYKATNSFITNNTIFYTSRISGNRASDYGIMVYAVDTVVISGNTIYNGPTGTNYGCILVGSTSKNSNNVTISNNSLINWYYGIYAGGTTSLQNLKIYSNVINATQKGIYVESGNFTGSILNNTVTSVNSYPIDCNGSVLPAGSALVIENNIFGFTVAAADGRYIYTPGTITGLLIINYNIYWNSSRANPYFVLGGAHIFADWQGHGYDVNGYNNTDPLFTNGGGTYQLVSDFALGTGSPCENTGMDTGLTLDYYGLPRVGNYDIGAIEKQ